MNENIAALLQGAGVKVTAERDATPAACTGHLKEVDEARGRGSDPPPPQNTDALGPGSGQYLRLAGKGHAKDGDASEDALPAHIADPPQPLPTEEAVLERGQHDLCEEEEAALGCQSALLPGSAHTRPRSQPGAASWRPGMRAFPSPAHGWATNRPSAAERNTRCSARLTLGAAAWAGAT